MGDNTSPRNVDQVIELMFQKSVHDYETDCWLWQGLTNPKGYGQVYFEGKTHSVHRVSFKHFCGEIDHGVYHSCDTPNCWNPKHLFTGRTIDNIKDAVKKRRHQFGERNGSAKLTEEDVIEIRESHLSCGQLAKIYGVTSMTVWSAKVGHTWRHLNGQ